MEDWQDPFAEDESARERERRRAEREARRLEREAQRRQQQGAVADRVRDLIAEPTGSTPSADPPQPSSGEGDHRSGDSDGSPGQDPARPAPRVGAAPAARAAAPPPAPPPGTPPTARGAQPPPPPPRRPGNLRRRRLIAGAVVVVAVIAIVAGLAFVADRLSNDGGATSGPVKTGPLKELTIPEGYDRRQTAALVHDEGISGDYMKASESFKGFDPAKYGAEDAPSLEGFLFPATYELPRKPTVDDLIARQLDAFQDYSSQVNMSDAKSKNLTTYDVLIIASMIEREAAVDKDRKLIAAVIYNRLRDGMPLAIDATIRFAEGNYTDPLTESDLEIDSPYNTYNIAGLPPTPISNPGLASIQAAAHPANVDYLYYVLKPDGCGHFFTASESEFQAASDRYDAARVAAGGQAPTDCS